MFAQFLTPDASLATQVTQLSAAFVVLGLFCHFPWIYGGQVILGRFNTPRAVRIQAAVFGVSMLAVAACVVLPAISPAFLVAVARIAFRSRVGGGRRPFQQRQPALDQAIQHPHDGCDQADPANEDVDGDTADGQPQHCPPERAQHPVEVGSNSTRQKAQGKQAVSHVGQRAQVQLRTGHGGLGITHDNAPTN
ncbi:hypothetical protein G6F65_019401 [Rhizopus arrhizus]|nr:hypothetical protein G6F65_019401 [Rhizopus arrhizus]